MISNFFSELTVAAKSVFDEEYSLLQAQNHFVRDNDFIREQRAPFFQVNSLNNEI